MAEYKGKLLRGLFLQAKNVLLSDKSSVTSMIEYDETSSYSGSAGSAVPAGARVGSVSVNIAKPGYTPIAVTLANCGAQASVIYTLDLKSDTTCEANIYAAVAGTPTYTFKVRVVYKKSSL